MTPDNTPASVAVVPECLTPGSTWETRVGFRDDYRRGFGCFDIRVTIKSPNGKGGVPYTYPDWFKNNWFSDFSEADVDAIRDAIHDAIEPIIGKMQGNPDAHRLAFQPPGGEASTIAQVEYQLGEVTDKARMREDGQKVGEWIAGRMKAAADRALAPTPDAALRSALEEIKNQKAERNCSDDYNRGWEAARWSARKIAEKALAATPSQKQGEGL